LRSSDAAAPARGHRPLTVTDLLRGVDRRGQIRRTPALTLSALRLVHAASRRDLFVLFAFQFAAGAGAAVQLLVAREFLQELIAVSDGAAATGLYAPVAGIALTGLVVAGAQAMAQHRQRLLGELVGRHAFDRIVTAASAVDYRAFETPRFHDELQRASASGELRILDMVNSVSQLTGALITVAGVAFVLGAIEPLLLVLVLLAAVPVLLAAIRNSRETYAFDYAMTPESRERAYLLDLMTSRSAAKEVRLLGLSSHLWRRYEALTDERLRRLRVFLSGRLRVSLLGATASALSVMLALGALVALLAGGQIDVAAALTAGAAMQQLSGRMGAITGAASKLIESGMFLDDYRDFVALADAAAASRDELVRAPRAAMVQDAPDVALDDVTFTYPAAVAPAVRGISLEIRPGETVALVGGNGSGKTTLVKLLAGLYRPDRGSVLWHGADAAAIPHEEIADDMCVLFQDYLEFHLTALDNIAFGRAGRDGTLEDAVAAASQAGAHEFLDRLPAGYGTRLGLEFHGGHELSGGQWQRLALARAFYRGGSFLILDEPTASLDPRAERALFEQMRRLAAQRSVLLISHRFSSVRSADRIYVMDDGRIVESGSHEELMAADGLYAEMFTIQATAFLADPVPTSSF
jgi:ATP-binding cassette, subfamily B, bacterial